MYADHLIYKACKKMWYYKQQIACKAALCFQFTTLFCWVVLYNLKKTCCF